MIQQMQILTYTQTIRTDPLSKKETTATNLLLLLKLLLIIDRQLTNPSSEMSISW
jgi:hypothetical protein